MCRAGRGSEGGTFGGVEIARRRYDSGEAKKNFRRLLEFPVAEGGMKKREEAPERESAAGTLSSRLRTKVQSFQNLQKPVRVLFGGGG